LEQVLNFKQKDKAKKFLLELCKEFQLQANQESENLTYILYKIEFYTYKYNQITQYIPFFANYSLTRIK
jgi:hypothetical protein